MSIRVEIENDCVGCPMGCINCGRKHTKYYYLVCDKCGEDVGELYIDEDAGEHLCKECLLDGFKKITDDNAWEFER